MRKQIIAGILVCSFGWNISVFGQVTAAATQPNLPSINAEELLGPKSDLRETISQGLKKPEVQKELQRLGVKQEEVELRLAAMTDTELQQIQQGVHRQAGGEVIVISTVTLLIIILVVLLLT